MQSDKLKPIAKDHMTFSVDLKKPKKKKIKKSYIMAVLGMH